MKEIGCKGQHKKSVMKAEIQVPCNTFPSFGIFIHQNLYLTGLHKLYKLMHSCRLENLDTLELLQERERQKREFEKTKEKYCTLTIRTIITYKAREIF